MFRLPSSLALRFVGWRFVPQDYGAFVDIGLGRVDALMPNAMMGEQACSRTEGWMRAKYVKA